MRAVKASPTSAFGARTTVFATPRAFHSPWQPMLGAKLQTLGWFGLRYGRMS